MEPDPSASATYPAPQRRTWGAASALGLAVASCGVLVAVARAPQTWLLSEGPTAPSLPPSPLGPLISAMSFPMGELAVRGDLLVRVGIVAAAAAAAWLGYQLFRGRGRWLAAATAGPIAAASLLHWAALVGPGAALVALPATVAAALGVAALVRSLVHFGYVAPLPRTRALAAAAFATLAWPPLGLPLLLAFAGICIGRRHPHLSARRRRSGVGGWARSLAVALALPAAAFAALFVLADASVAMPARIGWPALDVVQAHFPAAALYPALALIVLLVVPLRWRGGWSLLALATIALLVQDAHGVPVQLPLLLVVLAPATAGWIWLAGSIAPRQRPRLALGLAGSTAVVALSLAMPPLLQAAGPSGPAADQRPAGSFVRLLEGGLVAPRDGLILHDPWLLARLTTAQATDGWRPDVELRAASELTAADLLLTVDAWQSQGRRALSDSFDAGGYWEPRWVLESGALFWLIPEPAGQDADFRDLTRKVPDLAARPRAAKRRFTRWILERARYRRAVGEPARALEALPLPPDRQRGLQTRLQLARSNRPRAGPATELPRFSPSPELPNPEAAIVAEAADILYAHGARHRAAELFAEAGAAGYAPALGALARWQLRSGEDSAAAQTLATLARNPDLRREALDLVDWFLSRDRVGQAQALVDALQHEAPEPAGELGARLASLRAQARAEPVAAEAPDRPRTAARP